MKLAEFDAIIFDNDGVLVDSEIIHIAVERETLAELGLDYDQATYLSRFVGLSNEDYHSELRADFALRIGGELPADFAARVHERVWPRIKAELLPLGGVPALLEAFGGKVAVASSAPFERLVLKLKIAGLYRLFDPHIHSADHVERGKPAPDLFLHAARELGVLPERCAVIEDSVNGVLGAKAAGMTAIGFTGGGHCDRNHALRLKKHGADLVVTSHAELRSMI